MRDGREGVEKITGRERHFGDDEIIVSKTDATGKITYVNHVFETISGYLEAELVGRPHSVIRHPKMPRLIFKLLWERIQARQEIFAFVLNRCKNGDEYWVFAHVTPTLRDGAVVGYHSNRRTPNRAALGTVSALYARFIEEEQRHTNKRDAIAASERLLHDVLGARKMSYDELVWSLENERTPRAVEDVQKAAAVGPRRNGSLEAPRTFASEAQR